MELVNSIRFIQLVKNYYEVDGAAFTALTDANFGGAAASIAEAYAKAEDVPAKK